MAGGQIDARTLKAWLHDGEEIALLDCPGGSTIRRAPSPVLGLSGGTSAWVAAGYDLEQGATRMASAAEHITHI